MKGENYEIMKNLSYFFLIVTIVVAALFTIESCKKKISEFSEGEFIKELKRGWYVFYFQPNGGSTLQFDGDSVVYNRHVTTSTKSELL